MGVSLTKWQPVIVFPIVVDGRVYVAEFGAPVNSAGWRRFRIRQTAQEFR
jgi:hypothetical protein